MMRRGRRPIFTTAAIALSALFAILATAAAACGDDDDSDAGAGDTDTDSDTDTDGDADCSGCAAPTCIETVSGTVLYDDDTPMEGTVQVCVSSCFPVQTNAQGRFVFAPNQCLELDFSIQPHLHVTLFSAEGTHAQYAVSYGPTQAEVSDQGEDDFDFDVGTLRFYELTGGTTTYTDAEGAEAVDLDGVSFEIAPGAMETWGEDSLVVRVMEIPLEEWTPPFDDVGLDALYFIGPYFAEVDGGVDLHIDPAAAGWTDGDTGVLYQLGDYANASHLECDGGIVDIGTLGSCGTATFESGEISTSAVGRLGWIGLKRD